MARQGYGRFLRGCLATGLCYLLAAALPKATYGTSISMPFESITLDVVQNPGECTDEPITKDTAQEIFDSGAAHVVLFFDIVDEEGNLDITLWSNETLATFNFGLQGDNPNTISVEFISGGLAFNTFNFVAFANVFVDELPNLDMMIVGYSLEGSDLLGLPPQATGELLLTAKLAPEFIGQALCPKQAVTTMPSQEPLNNDIPISNILVCPQPIPPCPPPPPPPPMVSPSPPPPPTPCDTPANTIEDAQALFQKPTPVVVFIPLPDEDGNIAVQLFSSVTIATFFFNLVAPDGMQIDVDSLDVSGGLGESTPDFVIEPMVPFLEPFVLGFSLEGADLQGLAPVNGELLTIISVGEEFAGMNVCSDDWQFTEVMEGYLDNDMIVESVIICEGPLVLCTPTPTPAPAPIQSPASPSPPPPPMTPPSPPPPPVPCDEPAGTLEDAEAIFQNPYRVVLFVPLPDENGDIPIIIYSEVTLATFVFNLVTPEGVLLDQVSVSGGIAEETPDFVVEPMIPMFEPFILGFSLEGADLQGIPPVTETVLTIVNVGEGFEGVNICPNFWQFSEVQEGYLDNDVLVNGQVVCEGPIIPCMPMPTPVPMPIPMPDMSPPPPPTASPPPPPSPFPSPPPSPPPPPLVCGEPQNTLEDAAALLGNPFQVVLFFPVVDDDGNIPISIFSNEPLVTFAFNFIGPGGEMIMAESVSGGITADIPNFVVSIDLPVLVDYVLGFSVEPEDPLSMVPVSNGETLLVANVGADLAGMNVCSSMWQFSQVMGVLGNFDETLDGIVICEGPIIPCPPPPPSPPVPQETVPMPEPEMVPVPFPEPVEPPLEMPVPVPAVDVPAVPTPEAAATPTPNPELAPEATPAPAPLAAPAPTPAPSPPPPSLSPPPSRESAPIPVPEPMEAVPLPQPAIPSPDGALPPDAMVPDGLVPIAPIPVVMPPPSLSPPPERSSPPPLFPTSPPPGPGNPPPDNVPGMPVPAVPLPAPPLQPQPLPLPSEAPTPAPAESPESTPAPAPLDTPMLPTPAVPSPAMPMPMPDSAPPPDGVCPVCPLDGSGDINCDQQLDQTDADAILDIVAGNELDQEIFHPTIDCDILWIADGNGDGVVDITDASGFYSIVFGNKHCPEGFFQIGAPWIAAVCK